MGIILFIIVQVLSPLGNLVGTIWAMCQWKSFREVSAYYQRVAMSKDQYFNVTMRYFFNSVMAKDTDTAKAYKFGNPDETISSALGKNQVRGTLTKFGYFWVWFLHILDKDHSIKAIEADETNED